ncbi:GNAT family N-acetyltransferase [Staphylospora marina]|uniref:GNAT family N-acetyltransferase n=1 Tax=Staphylospora marina TaxID=2490858 RepID=UPI0013DD8CFC|nr:GNAT family protein [Staphylospora marina]
MIRLLALEREDCAWLFSWVEPTPAFLMQWAGPGLVFPLSLEQLERDWERGMAADSGRLMFKAVDERGVPVGTAELSSIDRLNGSARIRRVLISPECRGAGWGGRLIRELLRIGFEELGLHRMELGVFDFNEAAIRCYEKAGFVREGVSRECRRVEGRYWNLVHMGILAPEYRRLREGSESSAG